MKYEPTLRVGFSPFNYDDIVNQEMIKKLEEMVKVQESVIEKLRILAENSVKQRMTRFSLTASNVDLSNAGEESVMVVTYNYFDMVGYIMEFMRHTNEVLDLVANANTQLDQKINVDGDTTVYEDLLNAVD